MSINYKEFLEEQFQWCKERDSILEKIEVNLYKMKKIAEYAREQKLSKTEIEILNGQLDELNNEVHSLEKQLQSVVHLMVCVDLRKRNNSFIEVPFL